MLKIMGMAGGLILMSSMIFDWFMVLVSLGFILVALMLNMGVVSNFYCGVGLKMGGDVLCLMMVLLTLWVFIMMLMSSVNVKIKGDYESEYLILMVLMMGFLMLSFMSLDIFLFYLMFEASLIPTLMMIIGWGVQPERLQAGMYLIIYTLFASFPLLLVLTNILGYCSKSSFVGLESYGGLLVYFGLIMAFLVKMPLFFFHLWLPKAHVEAPVAGSMILAGVLLKLGGYGLIRFIVGLKTMQEMGSLWFGVGLGGGVITSMMCVGQVDMKALVAYSSIGHMGMTLAGIFSLNYWGQFGGLIMMVAHGLCSSGLFCVVNMMYEKMGSRSMIVSKGYINLFPSMSLWWFLLCVCNMAAPPSLNLGGEIFLICGVLSWSKVGMVSLMLLSFLAGVYSLYLYSFSHHGQGMFKFSMSGLSTREYLLMLGHWVPLNLLILSLNLFEL